VRKRSDTGFACARENPYPRDSITADVHRAHPPCATTLVAFDAALEITGATGVRCEPSPAAIVRLSESDLPRKHERLRGSIVTAIRIPAHPQTTRSSHSKPGETRIRDGPIAEAAVALDRADGASRRASVVLAATAPFSTVR
jgi:xanthine dehydrogenase YagS FAD-binding subunit